MRPFSPYFTLIIALFSHPISFFFFFNDTATTEIYTLSLHDALPILLLRPVAPESRCSLPRACSPRPRLRSRFPPRPDRKSTRLNSSHSQISYAVFCLKKKKRIRPAELHYAIRLLVVLIESVRMCRCA